MPIHSPHAGPGPRAFRLAVVVAAALPAVTTTALAQAAAPTEAALCTAVTSSATMAATRPAVQAQITAKPGSATADFLKGCLLVADDKPDKAADEFERATKKDPARSLYFDWLGRAYGDQAEHANKLKQPFLARKTKAAFEQAVKLDPDNLDARNYLVQYYQLAPGFLGGSEDKATEEAEAIRARNAYRGGFVMASVKQRRKDLAGAEREMVALTKSYPDSTAPWYSALSFELNAKRWSDAFRTADELRKTHPALPVNDYTLGRVAALSGEQLERGEAALRRYLSYTPAASEPSLAYAHFRLGQLLLKKGSADSARVEFNDALRLDPKLEDAKKALAALK